MRTLSLICIIASISFSQTGNWENEVEYSNPGISLKADIWTPQGGGPFPTAIVVHGGGWTGGDKRIEWVQPLFEPLQKAGFSIVTINYRLTPQSPYPAMVHDVDQAIRWVKKNAKKYKFDKTRIALIGESAGGHMVAYAGAKGKGNTEVAAVVDFYGAHDLLKLINDRDRGDMASVARALLQQQTVDETTKWKIREASPIEYVHKEMPPFLFIHGTKDEAVPYDQSPLMCDAMKKVNVACEVFTVEGGAHGMSNWEKNPAHQAYKVKMIDWLKLTLK